MGNNEKLPKWKLEQKTFNEIQQLKLFADFISNLEFTTEEDKEKIKEIKFLIENINNPNTHKNWNICLDIFDQEIQNGNKKNGFYWRKWSIYFELESLEIQAESNHTSEPIGHYGADFYYYGKVYFGKNFEGERIYLDNDIIEFVKDSINYKKYVTEFLNEIEIDIDIW